MAECKGLALVTLAKYENGKVVKGASKGCNTPPEDRPNTKPRGHGTPNIHNRWFVLCYHV